MTRQPKDDTEQLRGGGTKKIEGVIVEERPRASLVRKISNFTEQRKMASKKTPKLALVDAITEVSDTPPRPLGGHGAELWRAITSEYSFDDTPGREMLITPALRSIGLRTAPRRWRQTVRCSVRRRASRNILRCAVSWPVEASALGLWLG